MSDTAPAPKPREPPALRTAGLVRWGLIALSFAAALWSWTTFVRPGDEGSERLVLRYRCPMHPQIVSATPGECPLCGMALELVADAGAAQPSAPPAPGR